MTDGAKFTNRATDRDPFGVGSLTKGALGEWFPGGVVPKPTVANPSPLLGVAGVAGMAGVAQAPPAAPMPPSSPAMHTLANYHQQQEVAAAGGRAAPPPVLPSGSPLPQPSTPPSQPEWVPPDAAAPPTVAGLIAGEMKLQMLRGMFPQHSITPVEYDPFKAVPKGLGEKVDVNAGVG